MAEWRDISGYTGCYQVSSEGQVRSLPRTVMRKNGSLQTVRGRILQPGYTKAGYPIVALMRQGKQKMAYVHHLVLETFVGPCPEGQECRHRNGVEADCRLVNLCWGTRSENERDKERHGTSNHGARNGHAKLTSDAVKAIRKDYAEGVALHTLAERFGVAKETIFFCGSGQHLETSQGRHSQSS